MTADQRTAAIELIRTFAVTLDASSIRSYANQLPVDVSLAAQYFCNLFSLSKKQKAMFISSNVSIPWELYQLLDGPSRTTTTNEVQSTQENQ